MIWLLDRLFALVGFPDLSFYVVVPFVSGNELVEEAVALHEVINVDNAPVRHAHCLKLDVFKEVVINQSESGGCLQLALEDHDVVACVRRVIERLWPTDGL